MARSADRRAAWSQRTERRSLALDPALLREARANTRAVRDDVAFLATLAREITLTRGPELTLAFRSLVWVLPGFRTRRGARGRRVTSELCIVFVVRRKRPLAAGAPQHLPRWLVTFAEHAGVRKPFALPTDVQEATDYHQARAHGDSGVWVQRPGWIAKPGHFAALVALDSGGTRRTCLLSAQHVFSPFADGDALRVEGGLDVQPLDAAGAPAAAARLAVGLAAGGLLRGDERPDRPSFDVQLAEVDAAALARVRAIVPLRRLAPGQPWLRTLAELLKADQDGWFHLLTPDNHPGAPGRGALRMTLLSLPTAPVSFAYDLRSGGQAVERQVYHAELLAFSAVDAGKPLPGDSGSPIVVRHADGTMTLAAMHIGGDGQGLSWAIPAWQLFDLARWAQHPAGASVRPIDA